MSAYEYKTASRAPVPERRSTEAIGPLVTEAVTAEEYPFVLLQRDFPRVAKAIKTLWGTPELDDYLEKLIVTDRSDRAGFPEPALAALLTLFNQHMAQFNFVRPGDKLSHDPFARIATGRKGPS